MKNRILSLVLMLAFAVLGVTAFADASNQVIVNLNPGVSIDAVNATYNTTTAATSKTVNSYLLNIPSGTTPTVLSAQMSSDSRIASASPNDQPDAQFIFTANGTDGNPTQGDTPTSQFIFTANAEQGTTVGTDPYSQFIFTANGSDGSVTQDGTPVSQFIFTANADPTQSGQVVDPATGQFIFTANANPGFYAYTTQATSALINYGSTSVNYRGGGVLVAVLDTGISTRNSLLAQHVVSGWNFVDNNSNTDDSPTGLDSNGDGKADSDVGHGTMVAGLINRYAQNATLLPIKVLDSDGTGSLWAIVEGIRYAVARGAKVINMSFCSPNNSPVLQKVITDAWKSGVIIITAAGNNGNYNRLYPAGDHMTIAVGATDANDVKATFSNYGYWVDVVAPGVGIPSTWWTGGYAVWSGTSFSAPLVSAEAALIMSAQPTWSASKVRARIKGTATSVDLLNLPYLGMLGKGIINMDSALSGL